MIENRAVYIALSFLVTYGNDHSMRGNHGFLGLIALAATLTSAGAAAVIIPTANGGWATMTSITSVDTASIIGNLRWTDPLGNIKTATGVAVRPQIGAAASLTRSILARRLVVGAAVAGLLYETLTSKLAPGTEISADGAPQTVVNGTPLAECLHNSIKRPAIGTSSPTFSSFAYLPCAYATTGPTRLIIRIPVDSDWQPSAEWLNQYGPSSRSTRKEAFVLQGADYADTKTGFYEYIRPQPNSVVNVPSTSVNTMSEADQAALLMDPVVIGQLAQADAIPPDFFAPVDLATDLDPGRVSDDGSELPDGPNMSDVDSDAFDVMSYASGLNTQWLPRQCPIWPPLEIDFPDLHLQGRYDWPNAQICAAATGYIAPVIQICALALFLGIVFRKFVGGA